MVSYDAADLEMREIVKGGGQGPLKKTIRRLESKIVNEYRPNSINFWIILPWSTLLLDFRRRRIVSPQRSVERIFSTSPSHCP